MPPRLDLHRDPDGRPDYTTPAGAEAFVASIRAQAERDFAMLGELLTFLFAHGAVDVATGQARPAPGLQVIGLVGGAAMLEGLARDAPAGCCDFAVYLSDGVLAPEADAAAAAFEAHVDAGGDPAAFPGARPVVTVLARGAVLGPATRAWLAVAPPGSRALGAWLETPAEVGAPGAAEALARLVALPG